jgi:hypothetical protein
MKSKLLIVLFFMISFSFPVKAHWFPAHINVMVLPGQVSAEVYNPFYEPIICNGQVYGQTMYGGTLTVFFIEQFLPMGSNRFAFVQTTPFNPFIGGWANIHCRFVRFY